MSEKQSDVKKLLEKMRSNTDKQNRKTEALPARRFRKKMQRSRHADDAGKQKQPAGRSEGVHGKAGTKTSASS